MHLFDEQQHILIEVAGTLVFLVGTANILGAGIPGLGLSLGVPMGALAVAVGLVLMGYKKLGRAIGNIPR